MLWISSSTFFKTGFLSFTDACEKLLYFLFDVVELFIIEFISGSFEEFELVVSNWESKIWNYFFFARLFTLFEYWALGIIGLFFSDDFCGNIGNLFVGDLSLKFIGL